MRYLSRVIGNGIFDAEGDKLGVLEDVLARTEGKFPLVTGILYRSGRLWNRTRKYVDWGQVKEFKDDRILVEGEGNEKTPEGLLHLARDLLDKQIVDLEGYKIVRVSDIKLAQSGSEQRVVGADVGLTAIMRRLGLSGLAKRIKEHAGALWGDRTVSFDLMSPLEPGPSEIRVSLPYTEFRKIHPSDAADIIEQLDPGQRQKVFAMMDNPMAAEVLTQVLPGVRSSVAEAMRNERLSALLEIMEPDEAADILGSLSREKAVTLLSLMGIGESTVVRELLGYPEDTAGGRMTPEFISIQDDLTSQETIDALRRYAKEAELVYYAYVVDDEGRLKGVLSLRDLLREAPDRRVFEFMDRDVVSIHVDEDQEVAVKEITDHNLLAVPVVDEDNYLKGIVTVDDVMDVIKEERAEDMAQLSGAPLSSGETGFMRKRLGVIGLTFLSGLVGTALVGMFEAKIIATIGLIYFIPILLRIGDEVSLWSRVVGIWEIRGKEWDIRRVLKSAATEIPVTMIAAVALCGLGYIFARLWGIGGMRSLALSLGLLFSVVVAGLLGIAMPFLSQKLRTEPSGGEGMIARTIIAWCSIVIFLLICL